MLGDGMAGVTVMVVGDVILDRYVFGRVERISREAPVPVVVVEGEDFRLGGAGNCALNCAGMGVGVELVGVCGGSWGELILDLVYANGVGGSGILEVGDFRSPVKTRVVVGHHQVSRHDDLRCVVSGEWGVGVLRGLDFREDVDVVVISDYGLGFVTEGVVGEVFGFGVPVVVDSRRGDPSMFIGAEVFTPNWGEAVSWGKSLGLEWGDVDGLGSGLLEKLDAEAVVMTMGSEGMRVYCPDGVLVLPATAREVFDVTGAGDTVVGVLASSLALGMSVRDAAFLANSAAGVVVGEVGTTAVTMGKLIGAGIELDRYLNLPGIRGVRF